MQCIVMIIFILWSISSLSYDAAVRFGVKASQFSSFTSIFFCPDFQFCMEKGERVQLYAVLPSAKWSFYWPLSSETSS